MDGPERSTEQNSLGSGYLNNTGVVHLPDASIVCICQYILVASSQMVKRRINNYTSMK